MRKPKKQPKQRPAPKPGPIMVPAVIEPRNLSPMEMLSNALQRGVDASALTQLMGLAERWEANAGRARFALALSKAKAAIPIIIKNRRINYPGKSGGQVDFWYAELHEICRTIDPVLGEHELFYRWQTENEPNAPIKVTCIIAGFGHEERNSLSAPRDDTGSKNAIQAIGSTVTYLQRYTLMAALGLAAARDDDGEAVGVSAAINAEQLAKLQQRLKEEGLQERRICGVFGIAQLADLPETALKEAIERIDAYAMEKSKRAAEQVSNEQSAAAN